MKILTLIFLALLGITTVAQAEPASAQAVDPQSYAVAQDIVKSFDLKMQLRSVLESMSKVMLPALLQANPDQGDKIQKIITASVEKNMTVHMDEMEANKAKVYVELFSTEELKKLRDFYQSPLGQKMIKSTPEMMKRSMALDQSAMLAAIRDANHDIFDQLKKDGMKIPKELGTQ